MAPSRIPAPHRAHYQTTYDPIVLTHARALLTSDARGATAYIDADLRDTGKILAEAGNTLDFEQPVALMLLHILHFIPDRDDPYAIVADLLEPLAPGSYLVVSHASSDIEVDGLPDATQRYNRSSAVSIHGRSQAEVTRFFDGLDVVEPGVVPLGQWRPGPLGAPPRRRLPTYTAVGFKPSVSGPGWAPGPPPSAAPARPLRPHPHHH